MCYGGERLPSKEELAASLRSPSEVTVESLRARLAESEARLERARAREAHLTRLLHSMKRFVSVMEILETYLQQQLASLYSHTIT